MSSKEVRFINRIKEINALRDYCSNQRYTPIYIYGPEGCGKTRLLKEFTKEFDKSFGRDAIAIYIDAMENRDVKKALLSSSEINKIVNIFKVGLEASSELVNMGVPIGQALSRSISLIIDKIAEKLPEKSLKGKYILIAIDDIVRAIGLNKIEWYVKWLFELMNKLKEEYEPRAINFIATTSEGMSRRLVARHRHAHIKLLWNLDKKAFEELFYELNPSNVKFEDIWLLFGGNPGKLIELAYDFKWDIDTMLKTYEVKVREAVKRIVKEGLAKELELFTEDIATAEKILDKKMNALENILEEVNLILYKHWILLTNETFNKPQPDINIGVDYAWQVPMYRSLVMKTLKELKPIT